MRVIIAAAGDATRWSNYLNTPKHLIKIDNEPILYRTVRLFKERGITDIYIVGPDDNRYRIKGTKLFIPIKNPKNFDADKFLSSETLWSLTERTVVIFGDVFFTEQAIDTIINDKSNNWVAFGRYSKSDITGSTYGEMFGHSFFPNNIKDHKNALLHVIDLVNRQFANKGNGWEHYRVMQRVPDIEVKVHQIYENFVEINDWTEDFDFPKDYDRFIKRWNKK
jgi:CTP:phosphocholine cytidylyltransferase-like protein